MKSTILLFTIITLTVTLIGCKRQAKDSLPQEPGIVVSPHAGVSFEVGTGWTRIDADPGLPVCPPTLVGMAGMVRAMLFAPSISDLQAATKSVRSVFDGSPNAAKDSFHQEDFVTDSGLSGCHISYDYQSGPKGSVPESYRSHSFIVQRHDGRFVAITYITKASDDSDAVRQMIQKSLRLQ